MRRRTVLVAGAGLLAAAAAGGCAGPSAPGGGVSASGRADGGAQRFAYGEDPSQFGDLYRPSGDPRGVAVVVHGGFWKAQYDLEYGAALAADLAERGWVAWNIEYRRVGGGAGGGGGVPATLDDVTAAIAYLDELDLGVDLSTVPVVGIGHSAGGHLVTWAGAGGRLTHVVSQAGVLDLSAAHDAGLGAGAVEAFLGHPPTDADADIDPIRMVPLGVPVWCVHGRMDTIVPASQSDDYVSAARAAGATAELVEVDGDHFTVIDPGSPAWARTVGILDDL